MVRRAVVVGSVLAGLAGGLVGTGATASSAAPAASAPASDVPGGSYVPVTPSRLLDTRSGLGAARGATSRAVLVVGGRAAVPAAGVAAVVLNVTVTGASGSGFLAVSPTGSTVSSNVNYLPGRDVAQLVVSKVDDAGRVVLTTSSAVQVIADVVGWFTDPAHADAGALYAPSTPRRLFDSRTSGRLIGGVARRVPLTNVPAGATAVAVNLTTVRPDGNVYVTAWGSGPRPGTSSMNATRGEVRSNRAIVPVAADHSITVFVNAGRADVVVDLSGWFGTGAGGSRFVPVNPTRIADTRDRFNEGGYTSTQDSDPLRGSLQLTATSNSPVSSSVPPLDAPTPASGAWLTFTVVSPGWRGWLAVAPTRAPASGWQTPPGSSDINFDTGVTPNAVLAGVGAEGRLSVTDLSGPVRSAAPAPDLVVDLAGIFVAARTQPALGLWRQGRGDVTLGNRVDEWNRPVPGASGDIVEVAGENGYGKTAALRRDGSVLVWPHGAAAPTVLTDDAAHIAATQDGVYVVKRDGTVWTDDTAPGAHGTVGSVTGFAPVTGVSGVASIDVLFGGEASVAVGTDGTVVAWGGTNPAARRITWLDVPVTDVALDAAGIACVANADGSVDVVNGSAYRRRSAVFDAKSVVRAAELASVCYAVDGRGRVHELRLGTDRTLTETLLDGPVAAALVGSQTQVHALEGSYLPQVRMLATDGTVWDRVYVSSGHTTWVHVSEFAGATAIGGAWSLVTWVPPTR